MKRIAFLLTIMCLFLFSCSQKLPSVNVEECFAIHSDKLQEDAFVGPSNALLSAETMLPEGATLGVYTLDNVKVYYPVYSDDFCDQSILAAVQKHFSNISHNEQTIYDFFISEGQDAFSVVFYDATSVGGFKGNLFAVSFSSDKQRLLTLADYIYLSNPIEHIRSTVNLLYGKNISLDGYLFPEFYVTLQGITVVDSLGNAYLIPSDNFVLKPSRRVFVGDDYNPVINPDEKVVALTFDDGPHWTVTSQVLNVLKEKEVKATFFLLGCNIPGNEYLLRRMVNQGCDVGIHSCYHKNYYTMTLDQIRKDISDCAELISDATGKSPHLVRPPYGNIPETIIQEKEYFYINWCVDPYDWSASSAEQIKNHVIQYVKPGSIVLMHDIYNISCEALPQIIDELKADGWRFVTVSELFDLKDKEPSGETYYGLGY